MMTKEAYLKLCTTSQHSRRDRSKKRRSKVPLKNTFPYTEMHTNPCCLISSAQLMQVPFPSRILNDTSAYRALRKDQTGSSFSHMVSCNRKEQSLQQEQDCQHHKHSTSLCLKLTQHANVLAGGRREDPGKKDTSEQRFTNNLSRYRVVQTQRRSLHQPLD